MVLLLLRAGHLRFIVLTRYPGIVRQIENQGTEAQKDALHKVEAHTGKISVTCEKVIFHVISIWPMHTASSMSNVIRINLQCGHIMQV